MLDPNFVKLFAQWGFGGVIFLVLVLLIKWILKQQEKILEDAKEERTQWQDIVGKFSKEIENHTLGAKEFHNQVKEAHRYQREEHKEICTMCNHISTGIKEAVILLKTMNGRRGKKR